MDEFLDRYSAGLWHSSLVGSIRPPDLKYDAATGDTYVMATTTVSSPTVSASVSPYKFTSPEWLKPKSLSKTFPNSMRLRFSKYRGSNIILRDNFVDSTIDMLK